MNLRTSVEELGGIGKTYAKKLQNLGIEKVEDFIFYFPRRYEDYSNIANIVNAKPGEAVTLKGSVWQSQKPPNDYNRGRYKRWHRYYENNLVQPALFKNLYQGW